MKTKFISVLILLSLLFTTLLPIPVFAAGDTKTENANEIKVVLDGKALQFDVPPQIIDGRTMVPLRAIFEMFGAEVTWNDTTKTVTAKMNFTELSLQIGNKTLIKNNRTVTLDVPPQIIDSRTLVPVRAISESFGAEVLWDKDTKTVKITTNPSRSDSPYFIYEPTGFAKMICSKEKDWYITVDPHELTKEAQSGHYIFQNKDFTDGFTIQMAAIEGSNFDLKAEAQKEADVLLKSVNQASFHSIAKPIEKVQINDLDYYTFTLKVGKEEKPIDYILYYLTVWNNTLFTFTYRYDPSLDTQHVIDTVASFNPKGNAADSAKFIDFYLNDPATVQNNFNQAQVQANYVKPSYSNDDYTFYDLPGKPKLLVSANKDWYITADSSCVTRAADYGDFSFYKYLDENLYVTIKKADNAPSDVKTFAENLMNKYTSNTMSDISFSTEKAVQKQVTNGITYYTFLLKARAESYSASVYLLYHITYYDNKIFEFSVMTRNKTTPQNFYDMLDSFNPLQDKKTTAAFVDTYIADAKSKGLISVEPELNTRYILANGFFPNVLADTNVEWHVNIPKNYIKIDAQKDNENAFSLPGTHTMILVNLYSNSENKTFEKGAKEIFDSKLSTPPEPGATNTLIDTISDDTVNALPCKKYTYKTVYPDHSIRTTFTYLFAWDNEFIELTCVSETSSITEDFRNSLESFLPSDKTAPE